jgi:O-antigen ligase
MRYNLNLIFISLFFICQLLSNQVLYFLGNPPVVIFATLTLIVVHFITLLKRKNFLVIFNRPFQYFILLSLYLILSWFLMTNSKVSDDKLMVYLYAVFFPMVIIFLCSITISYSFENYNRNVNFAIISYASIWLSFFMVIVGLAEYFNGRLMGLGIDNPIWYGRLLGIPILAALFFGKNSFLKWLTIIIGLILVYQTGSRAVLLGLILCFFIYGHHRKKFSRLLYIIIPLGISVIAIYLVATEGYGNVHSVAHRLAYWKVGLEMFYQSPLFGMGIGNFGLAYGDINILKYPHNLLIEILAELGLFGFILFILFILSVFKNSNKRGFLTMTFIFFIFNAMFSGDISTNNHLFWFGLAASFNRIKYKVRI